MISRMRQEGGFSLLEVLITIILLAIGFLVAAKMQVHSLRSSQSAQMQANAIQISSEMMDKMRNNPIGVANGNYSGKTTSVGGAVLCATTGCSPAQLASQDLFEWSAHFIDVRKMGDSYLPSLPGAGADAPATGSISEPVNDVFTISIDWQGFTDGNAVAENFTVRFVP